MTLSDFYNEVSRRVDTEKTQINVADTKRVLSEAFKVLAGLDTTVCMQVLAKGITTAKDKGAAKAKGKSSSGPAKGGSK